METVDNGVSSFHFKFTSYFFNWCIFLEGLSISLSATLTFLGFFGQRFLQLLTVYDKWRSAWGVKYKVLFRQYEVNPTTSKQHRPHTCHILPCYDEGLLYSTKLQEALICSSTYCLYFFFLACYVTLIHFCPGSSKIYLLMFPDYSRTNLLQWYNSNLCNRVFFVN